METNIIDRIEKRINVLSDIFNEFYLHPDSTLNIKEKYGNNLTDHFRYTIEFDELIRDYPNSYSYYIESFLWSYEQLQKFYLFANKSRDSELGRTNISISSCINQVIKYLKKLLDSDNKIKEQPEPLKQTVKPPKGQTQLNREPTALLFWYLREKSLIAPQVTNTNLAKAVELMTNYSAKSIQEIIKMPSKDVSQLGKDEKKVTKQDLRSVISQLKILIKRIENDLNTNEDIRE